MLQNLYFIFLFGTLNQPILHEDNCNLSGLIKYYKLWMNKIEVLNFLFLNWLNHLTALLQLTK